MSMIGERVDRHETAETQFVEAGGVRFAYRTFGASDEVPLVFCHRFRGTMDDWDPAVVNGLARERPVVLFDNVGVGLSDGETPENVAAMARHAAAFIDALSLEQIDLIGFSMGGYVAQQLALDRPELVRKIVLAGTGPGGGEGILGPAPQVRPLAAKASLELADFQMLFFSRTPTSQAASVAYWQRLHSRQGAREPAVSEQTMKAQLAANIAWGSGDACAYPRLREISQPVLVANGNDDVMVPTVNSFIMSQRLPNAQLIIYPDSGHGFLFQYPELFVQHVELFLRG